MPDIIEIVLKFLDCVFIAFAIRTIHLRPPGDPWFHQMPEMIKWYPLIILFSAPDPFRAWANQAHVPFEDIPKLRQLVEAQFPQPVPSAGHARIVVSRVEIGRIRVQTTHEHGTELE